ncbi:S1C family serine protease [Saccharothrix deserti]|uniref:S1C family serine protease n=1 Tax=Saccharothrix deserti TaxID=2593674 RepID=UPI00131B24D4|nr:trypsin-like peptidase domain-containing protein [Saccharothrix deserti]
MRHAVAAVAIVVAVGGCTGAEVAMRVTSATTAPSTTEATRSYADLVERVSPSVVTVRTDSGVGSGVVFQSDVVVTNQHVVGNRREVVVEYADGQQSAGTVPAADDITDLAVVRTARNQLPVADFRRELPRPGDPVLAIGSPLGFANSVTAGIVSGLHREIPGSAAQSRALVDLIQTDAPISPGNSGGALLDTSGRVVGINEAYIPPEVGAVSLGFAIPSATAVYVAEQLLATGTVAHPYLGVSVGRLTGEIRERFDIEVEQGALVLGVDDGSPAASAGVRTGDVIVRLDDQDVRSVEDLLGALRGTEPGSTVTVEVVRDGQRQELKVEIGSRTR